MRGARYFIGGYQTPIGIIPAYAESTLHHTRSMISSQDHPRVCGEHFFPFELSSDEKGSSPRMRGAPSASDRAGRKWRIIPAYAGSTLGIAKLGKREQDHPRVCGEHLFRILDSDRDLGSSPRMRGARDGYVAALGRKGIIPAYAGSTFFPFELSSDEKGSSPRMRGARQ